MHLYGFSQYVGSGVDEEVYTALSPRQRVLMYLYYEEGYSQTEIEGILCSPKLNQSEISKELVRASYTSASVMMWNMPGVVQRMASLLA